MTEIGWNLTDMRRMEVDGDPKNPVAKRVAGGNDTNCRSVRPMGTSWNTWAAADMQQAGMASPIGAIRQRD